MYILHIQLDFEKFLNEMWMHFLAAIIARRKGSLPQPSKQKHPIEDSTTQILQGLSPMQLSRAFDVHNFHEQYVHTSKARW